MTGPDAEVDAEAGAGPGAGLGGGLGGTEGSWRLLWADLTGVDAAVIALLTAGTGLVGVQADMLMRLWSHPDRRSPMNALAGDMRVSGSSLTKLVDRLTELGLARRDASDSDRRVVYVVLTPDGENLAETLYGKYAVLLRQRVLSTIGGGLVDLAATAGALRGTEKAADRALAQVPRD